MARINYFTYNLDDGTVINDYGVDNDIYRVGVTDADDHEHIYEFYGVHKEDEARDFIDNIIHGDDD